MLSPALFTDSKLIIKRILVPCRVSSIIPPCFANPVLSEIVSMGLVAIPSRDLASIFVFELPIKRTSHSFVVWRGERI